ncbi:MAG: SIR2 family protein [Chloroflexota bacterium]|nr:SIR2 family protein [Chloroflexota bacterium]
MPTNALDAAANELRSWGAVAIIGAGASLEIGFPLTAQLQSLLWFSVDHDETLRHDLSSQFGRPNSLAKELIGSDPTMIDAAYTAIATSRLARRAYQQGFMRLDSEHSQAPSPAHRALAQMLHRRIVTTVISLNWDTLLERAYRRRYGSTLRADGSWLYKPHGDASTPDTDWVFPNQPGYIPDVLVRQVQALALDRPRVLLIVGYSERDEEVVRKLIGPLAAQWKVIRISPRATGDLSIAHTANEALPDLLRRISPSPELPGWEYVHFDHQHDLGPALDGQELGPADVAACPRLPEVDAVKRALRATNRATITGRSGCGKSITAYQAACDLCIFDGWEIVRLTDYRQSVDTLEIALANVPRRTIAIVDDAQVLDIGLRRRLLEMASGDLAAIFVSTSTDETHRGNIVIAAKRAVSAIAEDFKRRHDEILPIVQHFDPHIGDSFLQFPLDFWIDIAAECDTPWAFNFSLTRGEERFREEIIMLHEFDRADLALAAVAAGQILTRNIGMNRTALAAAIAPLGHEAGWLDTSLEILRRRRLVAGSTHLRCPHRRFAAIALRFICASRSEPEMVLLGEMFRTIVGSDASTLSGIAPLLGAIGAFQSFFSWRPEAVINADIGEQLLRRSWVASGGTERGNAAYLLNTLRSWYPPVIEATRAQAPLLGRWLELADAESAWGIGQLLNDFVGEVPDVVIGIFASADPRLLAQSLAHITLSEADSWGWLLGRVSASAPSEWRERLGVCLDEHALRALANAASSADISKLAALLQGLASIRPELSLQLLDTTIPVIAAAMNAAPIEEFQIMRDIIWFVLGYAPHFLRRRAPTPDRKRIARRLAEHLEAVRFAQAISRSKRRGWQTCAEFLAFLSEVAPERAQQVAAFVDFEVLDVASEGLWATFPNELRDLVQMLAIGPDREPAHMWVSRHGDELSHPSLILAIVAPDIVAERIRAGHTLDLSVEDGFHWPFAALAIQEIAQIDEALAVQVVEDNIASIARGLASPWADECEIIPAFLEMLRSLSTDALGRVIAQIDPMVAKQQWGERLRGKIAERRAVASLLDAAIAAEPLTMVVTDLRRRFPAASRTPQVPDDCVEGDR